MLRTQRNWHMLMLYTALSEKQASEAIAAKLSAAFISTTQIILLPHHDAKVARLRAPKLQQRMRTNEYAADHFTLKSFGSLALGTWARPISSGACSSHFRFPFPLSCSFSFSFSFGTYRVLPRTAKLDLKGVQSFCSSFDEQTLMNESS